MKKLQNWIQCSYPRNEAWGSSDNELRLEENWGDQPGEDWSRDLKKLLGCTDDRKSSEEVRAIMNMLNDGGVHSARELMQCELAPHPDGQDPQATNVDEK